VQFSNAFEVPLPPDAAWAFLMDIERIVPCVPGAELTEIVDQNTYKGKVSVRLGPVALTFSGVAKFEVTNNAARRARVKAQGTDNKGRGGAAATVNFQLEPSGTGSKVLVDTDLALSGAVAQYGRGAGMIQNVAAQLINQFAEALKGQIVQMPLSAPAAVSNTATTTPPSKPVVARAAKPIGGFSLLLRAIWAAFLGLFSRRSV
jgi:carbon monoxide dehydrogenase subunit G